MRLIDADALPRSWQPNCNGSRWFVSGKDLDSAPTVCCERCTAMVDREGGYRPAMCDFCYCGSNFEEATSV